MEETAASGLCDEPVWDWGSSWDGDRPRLGACFRALLVSSLPCSLLWLMTLLDLILSRCKFRHEHKCGPFPWTLLALCKQAMTCSLLVCTACEGFLIFRSSRVETLSSGIRFITYVLALFHQVIQRRRGRLSSAKLAIFWSASVPCQFIASPIFDLMTGDLDDRSQPLLLFSGAATFALVCGEAVLSHFTDPQYEALFPDPKADEYLIDHQSPLSRLLFAWISRLVSLGRRQLLCPEDLDCLRPDVRTDHVSELFLRSWSKEEKRKKNKGKRPSLLYALIRITWPWLLVAMCLDLLYDFALLLSPIVLDWLITFVEDEGEPTWHGPVYACMLLAASLTCSLLNVHNLDFLIRASVMPRSGLQAAIYRKVFRLGLDSRRAYSLGELSNLLSVDVERIFQLVWSINSVWSSPLSVALTLALLWRYLGPACLLGFALTLLVTPATALIALKSHAIQTTQMELKDYRLRIMNEILNGIKVLKLFAWEPPFVQRVNEVRGRETSALKKYALLNAAVTFLWLLTPFLVSLCSFVAFVLLGNVLDPSTAFVSLTLFARLKSAMAPIPQTLSEVVQSRIAFRRVTDFLMSDEQDETYHEAQPPSSPGTVFQMDGASFSWGSEGPPFLQDLCLSVGRGRLLGVVGRVGSGKSALISALLGEMTLKKGEFKRHRDLRVAYVPQTAWIQNATLRQNVLFVNPMERGRYDSVLRGCCLRPDLKTLPASDHTEIGEKGVNLSGGQRQRVSLARAVYHDAELYLMDDPLSSVDAHVARHIFEDVIGPKGMLAHKTRVLVTHDLSLLPHCDNVLVMSGGRILESGSYQDLVNREGGELGNLVRDFADREKEQDDQENLHEQSSQELRMRRIPSVDGAQHSTSARFIEAERIEVGRVRASVFSSYFRSAGLTSMTFVFLGFAAYQAFEIGGNVWLSRWSEDNSQELRNLRMTVYGLLGFAQGACVLCGSVLLALAATKASVCLHKSMLWRVMRAPLLFFETTPIGRILNRFGKDIQGIDVTIPDGLSSVVTVLASLAGTLAVICANHPIFLLLCLPIAIVYIYVQILYMASSRQLRRLISTTMSPVLSFFSECAQGASTVRAFGCQAHFVRRQHSLMDTNCQVFFAQSRLNRWLGVRLQLLGSLVVFVVALMSVLQRSQYSAALVGLTLSYALNVTYLLGQMVRLLTQLETRMVSVERVNEYSRLPQEASWNSADEEEPLTGWPSEGAVVFSGYKMRYRPDTELVLKGIDLDIPGGQKVGVVGRTGGGKTSLAHALFRVVEASEGSLFVDGVDIATISLQHLRSRLTVIPQEPVLFGGNLRLNLDPEGRHTDEELIQAIRQAGIDSEKRALDMEIDEGGGNLSLGERQQVCLARALVRKSRILVMDEATAAVDLRTDSLVRDTVRREFPHSTVITVAHRLHTVLQCDRILVMEQGRIVEDGPPQELLKKPHSHFGKLAQAANIASVHQ